MNDQISIILAGDICPTKDTENFFKEGDASKLFNDVHSSFISSDFAIANLEFPLTNSKEGIFKAGPVLRGNECFIEVFKQAKFDVLSLANNHIKDCGEHGVLDTLKVCKDANIETVGAGKNLRESKKPLIKKVEGFTIGIMAFAEQEYNTASENNAGANYLDIYYDFDEIAKVKESVDYLIVLYHGGIEYYKYPSPLLQKKCRKIIESGADLISCQHSHCIGTFEAYGKGKIIYGQGNTVFGFREGKESWNEGLLLEIILKKNAEKIESFLKYQLINTKEDGSICFSKKEEQKLRLQEFYEDSKKLSEEFIVSSWKSFCKSKEKDYYAYLFGFNRLMIHANRRLGNLLVNLLYTKRRKSVTQNIIRCEAHNEVLQTILQSDKK